MDVPEYFVWLFWSFLSMTAIVLKNPRLDKIMPSLDALEQLLNTSLVIVAPGLLEVLRASTPPTIKWFKSLPSNPKHVWAVYLLVLEKDGSRSKIYVGSATNSTYGVVSRFKNYDARNALPVNVEAALKKGFVITHKGILVSSPIPAYGFMLLPLRGLFLLMEATFAIVFWAMECRTISYNMPPLCPWELDLMEYDGLCSHSCIHEGIRGELQGLKPAEVQHMTDEVEARRKLQIKKDNARYMEKYYFLKENDFETWQAQRRLYGSRNDPAERKRTRKNVGIKNRTTEKYKCPTCDLAFPAQGNLTAHFLTKGHTDAVRGTKKAKNPGYERTTAHNKSTKKYHCAPCNFTAGMLAHYDSHCTSKLHHEKAGWSRPKKDAGKHVCCGYDYGTSSGLERHKKSKSHKDNAARAAESAQSMA